MYIDDTRNSKPRFYYVHKDYLGSILALSNNSGVIVAEYNYDAWGRRRDADNWNYTNVTNPVSYRGFTGHSLSRFIGKMLDEFELINMFNEDLDFGSASAPEFIAELIPKVSATSASGNGRIYDPYTAQFLRPDNYVHMPEHVQNLNRYAYCLNNPLVYTDPAGSSWLQLAPAGSSWRGHTVRDYTSMGMLPITLSTNFN